MAQAVEYDEFGQVKQVDPNQFQQAAQNQGIAAPAPAPAQQVAWSPKLRDSFVSSWRDSGLPATTEALRQFVAQQGQGHFQMINEGGKDKVRDSQGRVYDLIGNVGTAQAQKRTGLTTDKRYASVTGASSKSSKTAGAKAATGGGGGAAAGGGGTGFNTGGLGAESKGLFDLLMERARSSEQVDPNDPIIKAQTDAYRAEGEQARRDFLAAAAEAGGPYGNLRSETRRSAEELGKSTGGFRAAAMQQELTARRAKIESALAGAAGFLTDQQRMALQNELTRLQLAQQESQFGRSLKSQESQFSRNLSQQNSQFGRSLGQRAYEFDTSRFDSLFA